MSYNIQWQDSNIIVSFEGVVTFQEVNEMNGQLYGDIRYDNMKYQIADFSKMEKYDLNAGEVKIIGALDKSSSVWNNYIKIAVVNSIQDPDLLKKLKPYTESIKKTNWSIQFFENIIDAKKWCLE